MKSKLFRENLQKVDLKLQKRSFTVYHRMLQIVCEAHSAIPSRTEFLDILRKQSLSEGDVRALVALADSLSTQLYVDATQHFVANQFSLLIRKYPFPKDRNPFDPEAKGIETFLASERRCRLVNRKFRIIRKQIAYEPMSDVMARIRQFISYVIGFEPPIRSIIDDTGFGPGAAIGVHGSATNAGRKLLADWSVSPGAYHLGFAAVMNHAQVREILFPNPGGFTSAARDYDPFKGPYSEKTRIVAHNKIAFVPKTAKTHRSIAIEPLINGFLQKGVDQVLRRRLRRIGIDLSDQTVNQRMARLGSMADDDETFCTIDLAAASDSIATEVMRDVLPPEWFYLLDTIRSKSFCIGSADEPIRYEKFCSMGNGFTFPLQTLLYSAACSAVGAGTPGIDFQVYGDDIIVRRKYFDQVVQVLRHLGFRVNTDKTFSEGPFRESCGSDWFGGIDVRPYTLDCALDSIQAYFKALNGMCRSPLTEAFFEQVRPFLLSQIPLEFRFFRPFAGPDDTGITSRCDEFLTSPHCTYRFKNGTGKWTWKEFISTPKTDRFILRSPLDVQRYSTAVVYAALTGSASSLPFALRRETKTKVRRVSHSGATSQWLPPHPV